MSNRLRQVTSGAPRLEYNLRLFPTSTTGDSLEVNRPSDHDQRDNTYARDEHESATWPDEQHLTLIFYPYLGAGIWE